MARRKNVKRIDPRYFLHETVNREEEPLEEFLSFSKKEKLAKKVKKILAMIDKAGGKYNNRPVHDFIKEPFAIAIAKGANPRTAKMSYPEALDAFDLEQEELQALKQVYVDEVGAAKEREAARAKDKRMSAQRDQRNIDAISQRDKDARATAQGAEDLKDVFRSFDRARGSLKKNMKSGQPGLAKELLRNAEMVQKYAQGRDKQELAKVMQALEKFAGEAGIEQRHRDRPSTSRTGGYGSSATDKYRWHKE